jgi:hypothetical protein
VNAIEPSFLNKNGVNYEGNKNKFCSTVSWCCSADEAVAVGHSSSGWSCVATAFDFCRGWGDPVD